MTLSPHAITFCLLSFEGPDRYSLAGGLGVRITHLAETLAERGFETHLIFIGDPGAEGRETRKDGRLTLHRWGQWISAYHPTGVYDGEEGKLADFNENAPRFIMKQIILPALATGRLPVILAEEWHTAEALIRLHDQLEAAGLRHRCVLFWNANNTMSFHRVNWLRLNQAAQTTTVSRYMKHLMWDMDLNPLVIPNGIPSELLKPVPAAQAAALRTILDPTNDAIMLFKVGRFDPAKRWLMAVEAAAQIKAEGHRVVFPLRGGIESHGIEVLARAQELGLTITHIDHQPESWEELLSLLRAAQPADIYHLDFFMPQEFLRPFYAAADAVLANSGHEPFGLVGLEAMAASGLVFTGTTGEEYTLGGQCAVALDTDAPAEIVNQVLDIRANQTRAAAMRQAAHTRAAAFTWEQISDVLLEKVKFVAQLSGAIPRPNGHSAAQARHVLIYTVVHRPRRLRLPAEPLPPCAPAQTLFQAIFDDALNETVFREVAAASYYPAVEQFRVLLRRGFKFAIGFSLSFLEQAQRWDEGLLDCFSELAQHENVELVAVEPTRSVVSLWDIHRFVKQMHQSVERLEAIFGKRPTIAETTGLMMSDVIYHALDQAGFKASFMDGRSQILDWRRPTHLYHHDGRQMKLLTRHINLSDDVGTRFSDQNWSRRPLRADQYADWLAGNPGQLVVLGWNLETFGERQRSDSGIFDFLAALPGEAQSRGLTFTTPSEAVARYGHDSFDLPFPAMPSEWGRNGGQDAFLGNEAQQDLFRLMMQAYLKALLTNDPELVELSLWLAQSDNLRLSRGNGRADAESSAKIDPQEWQTLGDDRIAIEMQQVCQNFINALDSCVN
jgi:glycosyltransferase involved in cell wall biosynthesis